MSPLNSHLSATSRPCFRKPCPEAGSGVHRWVFYAACWAAENGISYDEAERLIEGEMTREPNPASEVADALNAAYGVGLPGVSGDTPTVAGIQAARASRSSMTRALRRIERNGKLIAQIASSGPTLLDLWRSSPLPIVASESRAEEFVDRLFPADSLICAGHSDHSFGTHPRPVWRGELATRSLLVPSPMIAVKGRTKGRTKGREKLSFHTLDNTGPRHHLIIEFDTGTLDRQAALIAHLAKEAPLRGPLTMVVFSASKSLHAWFRCKGQPEEKLYEFMRYAVSIGADPATWLRSQFVRLPDGHRNDKKYNPNALPPEFPNREARRQSVIYFNPEVIR